MFKSQEINMIGQKPFVIRGQEIDMTRWVNGTEQKQEADHLIAPQPVLLKKEAIMAKEPKGSMKWSTLATKLRTLFTWNVPLVKRPSGLLVPVTCLEKEEVEVVAVEAQPYNWAGFYSNLVWLGRTILALLLLYWLIMFVRAHMPVPVVPPTPFIPSASEPAHVAEVMKSDYAYKVYRPGVPEPIMILDVKPGEIPFKIKGRDGAGMELTFEVIVPEGKSYRQPLRLPYDAMQGTDYFTVRIGDKEVTFQRR